jgi:GABA permease
MLFSLSKRGDAPKSFGSINRNGSPWMGVLVSSLFALVATYLTATESMNVYDIFMLATGTAALCMST